VKIRGTLTLRNEVAIAAREKLGMSQRALATAAGVRVEVVGCIERMQLASVSDADITKLAAFYCVEVEELAPTALREQKASLRQQLVREIAALDTLTFREREILKLRYGLNDGEAFTLREVGRIFRINPERVRQIEARAIRNLQNPERNKKLSAALGIEREMTTVETTNGR